MKAEEGYKLENREDNKVGILFATLNDLSGESGNNIATKEMSRSLLSNDAAKTFVICPKPENPFPKELKRYKKFIDIFPTRDYSNYNYGIRHIPLSLKDQILMARKIVKTVKKENIDVIISRKKATFVAPLIASKLFNVPHILLIRGRFRPKEGVLGKIQNAIYATEVRSADHLIVAYHEVADEVKSIQSKGRDNVTIIPNAVDGELFSPREIRKARSEINTEIESDEFVVGFAGSLKERHKLPELIKSVAKVESDINTRILIVGSGPQKDKLEQLAKDYGVYESTTFTGFVPHNKVEKYLNACNVLYGVVDQDNPENPIKCYEYLACSKPIITTKKEELEFVSEVNCGYRLEYIDEDHIAKAIEWFYNIGNKERSDMGMRGRRYVVENHTWRIFSDRTISIANTVSK